MHRRHFLTGVAGAVVGLAGGSGLYLFNRSSAPETLKHYDPSTGPGTLISLAHHRRPSGDWTFGLLDQRGRLAAEWVLPYGAHLVLQHPHERHLVLGVEKVGMHASVSDIREPSSYRLLQPPDGYQFYGHGAFSADGNWLAITLVDLKSEVGGIQIYDALSLKPIRRLPSYGLKPHDMQLNRNDSSQLLVANRGGYLNANGEQNAPDGYPSFVTVDLKSGDLIHKTVVTDPRFGGAHFSQSEDGKIFLYGPRNDYEGRDVKTTSVMSFRLGDESVTPASINWPVEFANEALNAFVDDKRQRVWVSLPYSHRMIVVDSKDLSLIKEIELEKPSAFVHLRNKDALLVSTLEDGGTQAIYELESMDRVDNMTDYMAGYGEISLESVYGIHTTPFTI